MTVNIHQSWTPFLQAEFDKPYFKTLVGFVKEEYKQTQCFPPGKLIFNAFDKCHFNDLKVVIIGQDPYHNYNQANGLCFSVNEGVKHPPSLINIFKEIETDLGITYPESGNLTLTVRAHNAGSHQKKGWETFTDAVIKTISENREDVVFLLWGGFAKKKMKLIDSTKHHVLMSGHPSPLSANRGYWFGNKHFSRANEILKAKSLDKIKW